MTAEQHLTDVEHRLAALDLRLLEVLTECRQIREELVALTVRIEPAIEGSMWVGKVLKHQAPAARRMPEGEATEAPEASRREPFVCRWLGHAPGPQMGLMVTCTRCGLIYRLGRGR
jgi:hypothetical protein